MSTVKTDTTLPLLGGHYHFLLRRLHSLTGIVFGGYLVVHLIVNATIAQGGRAYQVQVDKLESLPFVWLIEWTLIYIPILYHAAYGTWIILTGQPNAASYPYAKNWLYLLQRISAGILVLFLLFHVLSLRFHLLGSALSFNTEDATYTTWRHMHAHPAIAYFVYPVGILASCFHLANGFWTAGITWGLTVSSRGQRRWGLVCILLFIVTYAFGMVAWIALLSMVPPASLAR
ncbi:MAG: hypothetical protein ACM359_04120 [Bacillota bacterium]